jgi:outer membrane beta-barrel protein
MKKIRIVLLAATAALCSYPVSAFAQDDAETSAAGGEGGEEGATEDGADGEDKKDSLDAEVEGEGSGGLGDICKIDPQACPEVDFDKAAARPIREPLYAVQQIFVLRALRLEVQPQYGFTLNDQFVSHNAPSLALNFWITNVLAVGVNGNYYGPFNSDSAFNFQTRRAARVNVPLTEYNWGAALNFTYAPILGKFAAFGDFIFQYDGYVVGGVGAISTKPIPVIDPDNRFFDYKTKLAFNAGIGIHIFFNRWFAATLEVRDYIFNDQLEATKVDVNPTNKAAWVGEKTLTNDVQAQIGLSIFFPFTFEYRLPK